MDLYPTLRLMIDPLRTLSLRTIIPATMTTTVMCISKVLRFGHWVQACTERRDVEIKRMAAELETCDHSEQATLQHRAETHENIILQLHEQVVASATACCQARL